MMKKVIISSFLLLMTLPGFIRAQSSPSAHLEQGYTTFGINGGAAYQQSDVMTDLHGFGGGITYGKNLFYKPGFPFAVDARGRLQFYRSYGADIRPTYGIEHNDALNGTRSLDYTTEEGGGRVFANHRTDQVESAIEGVITFSDLRDRTGVGVGLYAGAGLSWYKTAIDQQNSAGTYADLYRQLDDNGSASYNTSQLSAGRDGIYETLADDFSGAGKLGIMPRVGLELTYDLSPAFSIGLGHKVTFSSSDLLDGQRWNNLNQLTGDNDILHYTSIGLNYRFNKNATQKNKKVPVISIYAPGHSTQLDLDLYASVENVSNALDIDLKINDHKQAFDWKDGALSAPVRLIPGNNIIQITAFNQNGTTTKTANVKYQPQEKAVVEFGTPEIDWLMPDKKEVATREEQGFVKAKVRLINNKGDVEVLVNGHQQHFDYQKNIAEITATTDWQKGENIVEIIATNRNGTSKAQRIVVFHPPVPRPVIEWRQPRQDRLETSQRQVRLEASLSTAANPQQLELLINGRPTSRFQWNARTGRMSADVSLQEGTNEIVLRSRNESGEEQAYRQIFYRPVPRPTAQFTSPAYETSTTREPEVIVQATIREVRDDSDIYFRINDQRSYEFQWDAYTGRWSAPVRLQPGLNHLELRVSNISGEVTDRLTIQYDAPVFPPPPPPVQPIIAAPVIEWGRVANQQVVTEEFLDVRARIYNLTEFDELELRLNRRRIRDFRYNPATGLFRASVRLEPGNNRISLEASNPAGRARERFNITYRLPYPPKIDMNISSGKVVSNAAFTLRADVEGVEDRRDIALYLNGNEQRNWRWEDQQVSTRLMLQEGANSIEIVANNRYGTERAAATVNYQPPNPPVITFERTSGEVVSKSKYQLAATIQYVEANSDVRLFINDRASRNFKRSNNRVTLEANLRPGENRITLKATNDFGTTREELLVILKEPQLPAIQWLSHRNGDVLNEPMIAVRAVVENIASRRNVQFILNGKEKSEFYIRNGEFRIPVRLEEGENRLRLMATNEDGTTTDELKIIYQEKKSSKEPVKVPEITSKEKRTMTRPSISRKKSE